jgi:hypothetical protein
MVIELQRFGGFAGISRPPLVLDTDHCTSARCAEIVHLVQESNFFELPSEILPDSPAPDSFQYVIRVRSGDREHTVTTTENAAPESLRSLLRAVRTALREK